jgi:hypothetical protein
MFVKKKYGHVKEGTPKGGTKNSVDSVLTAFLGLFTFAFRASAGAGHLNQPYCGNRLLTNKADPEVNIIDLS